MKDLSMLLMSLAILLMSCSRPDDPGAPGMAQPGPIGGDR